MIILRGCSAASFTAVQETRSTVSLGPQVECSRSFAMDSDHSCYVPLGFLRVRWMRPTRWSVANAMHLSSSTPWRKLVAAEAYVGIALDQQRIAGESVSVGQHVRCSA